MKWIYDFIYTILKYYKIFNSFPNLYRPKTFNEHLTRKKLFDRNPLLRRIADKYQVRAYVEQKVGSEYLTEIYSLTDNFNDINFNKLPNSFVLKLSHGSGMNYFVKDKRLLDYTGLERKISQWCSTNYYDLGREWCYNGIKPRIIIEEFLMEFDGKVPKDYKIFCFHGTPKIIQIDIDRFIEQKRALYDVHWTKIEAGYHYEYYNGIVEKPKNINKMLEIASMLSKDFDFIRVDLYNINGRIKFGELTNYPGNGFEKFSNKNFDIMLGEYWREKLI